MLEPIIIFNYANIPFEDSPMEKSIKLQTVEPSEIINFTVPESSSYLQKFFSLPLLKQCSKDAIVVFTESEDKLYSDSIIADIREVYATKEVLMTYSITRGAESGSPLMGDPYSNTVQARRNYKKVSFVCAPLRTVKLSVLQQLRPNYFKLKFNSSFIKNGYPVIWYEFFLFTTILEIIPNVDKCLFLPKYQYVRAKNHREIIPQRLNKVEYEERKLLMYLQGLQPHNEIVDTTLTQDVTDSDVFKIANHSTVSNINIKTTNTEDCKFVIFSAGRNCEQYIDTHISSIQAQTFKEYLHIIVDDASEDGTTEKLAGWKLPNTIIYHNEKRIGLMANAVHYLSKHSNNPHDIIAIVDLDDSLFHDNVLENVFQNYKMYDCWITYSRLQRDTAQKPDNIPPYPDHVLVNRAFRKCAWHFMSLRTYKCFLWNAIDKKDLLGPDGVFAFCANDIGISFPMLEMAGKDKIKYIPEVQYLYSWSNPSCNAKTIRPEQVRTEKWFRSKPKYSQLIE